MQETTVHLKTNESMGWLALFSFRLMVAVMVVRVPGAEGRALKRRNVDGVRTNTKFGVRNLQRTHLITNIQTHKTKIPQTKALSVWKTPRVLKRAQCNPPVPGPFASTNPRRGEVFSESLLLYYLQF